MYEIEVSPAAQRDLDRLKRYITRSDFERLGGDVPSTKGTLRG